MDSVVVDTNTITFDDWNLRHAPWRLLLHRAAAGTTRLVVPEVAILEVVGVYGRALRSLLREAGSNLGYLRALGIAVDLPTVGLAQAAAGYEKALSARLRSARLLKAKTSSRRAQRNREQSPWPLPLRLPPSRTRRRHLPGQGLRPRSPNSNRPL